MKIIEESVDEFKEWLVSRGFIFQNPTSKYEVFRAIIPKGMRSIFGKNQSQVLVLYRKQSGRLTLTDPIRWYFGEFQKEGSDSSLKKVARQNSKRKRSLMNRLLDRDGYGCWYCGQLGEDTLEHLLSVKDGGVNTMANCVRAHKDCNNLAGSRSIAEKVALRDQIRAELEGADLPPWDYFEPRTSGVMTHEEYQRTH